MIKILMYAPALLLLPYPIFFLAGVMGLGGEGDKSWVMIIFYWTTILYPVIYIGLMVLFFNTEKIYYLLAFYIYLFTLLLSITAMEYLNVK
jgi:hypothetical protein